MRKKLKILLLVLVLLSQLHQGFAAEGYDEEITLPVGSNFDLNIPEVCGYEVDQDMVTMKKLYGKDTPVLKKIGDTTIVVLLKLDDNSRMQMNILVHVISQEQFMKIDNGS